MSRSGYWSGLERPVATCSCRGCTAHPDTAWCWNRRARVGSDGRRLCKACRAVVKEYWSKLAKEAK